MTPEQIDRYKFPKILKRALIRYADKIEEISDERKTNVGFGPLQNDGIWVYTKPGWWNGEAGTTTIHEWSIQDLIRALKYIEKDPRYDEQGNPTEIIKEQPRPDPGHSQSEYEKKHEKIQAAGFAGAVDPSGNKGGFLDGVIPLNKVIEEENKIGKTLWIAPNFKDYTKELRAISQEKKVPYASLVSSFNNAEIIDLYPEIWRKLENTDSNKTLSKKQADEIVAAQGNDIKKLLYDIENANATPAPIVLQTGPDQYTLVSGNTKLLACRILDRRPRILLMRLGKQERKSSIAEFARRETKKFIAENFSRRI